MRYGNLFIYAQVHGHAAGEKGGRERGKKRGERGERGKKKKEGRSRSLAKGDPGVRHFQSFNASR